MTGPLFTATKPSAIIPTRATSGSAGYDLSTPRYISLYAGETTLVDLGLTTNIPDGHVGLIYMRSGLAIRSQISLTNGTGVIDSDYEGPLMVSLTNNSQRAIGINAGDRIAQMVVVPFITVGDESTTKRGEGGFGSTGN